MKHLLEKIIAGENFNHNEAHSFIMAIEQETLSNEIIAGILVGLQQKGITIDEIQGFRSALLELSNAPILDAQNAIDLCGTGGDGKDTFNISTTSSLVLASMGYKVIKHGNYGVSSICGSSNVLEELGYEFTANNKLLEASLDKKNICFLHAPLFHPTMKKVAPIRKSLGIRTIFNCLGPLVNPVQPQYQLTGTYSLELSKLYQHILKDIRSDYRVVYGMDGYDEITLTDSTRVLGKHVDHAIDHSNFNTNRSKQSEILSGHSIQGAAMIIKQILSGQGTNAQNNVIAANVAVALQMFEPNSSLQDSFNEATTFLKSGHATQILNN